MSSLNNPIHALHAAAEVVAKNPLILDTETTGIDNGARIVNICLMEMDGKIAFESLINPEIPIPTQASQIHGITDATVQGAPTWPAVNQQIAALMKDRFIAGYNTSFDLRMLNQMDAAYELPDTFPDFEPTADVMLIYADYYGEWDDYHGNNRWQKLSVAARQLGIAYEDTHTARADCDLTRRVLLNLAARAQSHKDIDWMVRNLAILRQDEAEAKEALAELRAELESSQAWVYWKSLLNSAEENLERVAADIRQAATECYQETRSKSPHPAVSIRLNTRLEYDPDEALSWCMTNLPRAIALDAKFFEKHARAIAGTDPLTFVRILQEPTAAIASNLDDYVSPVQPEPVEEEEPGNPVIDHPGIPF